MGLGILIEAQVDRDSLGGAAKAAAADDAILSICRASRVLGGLDCIVILPIPIMDPFEDIASQVGKVGGT